MILTKILAHVTAGTIHFQLSDHLPIYANFYVEIAKEQRRRRDEMLTRDLSKAYDTPISMEAQYAISDLTGRVQQLHTQDAISDPAVITEGYSRAAPYHLRCFCCMSTTCMTMYTFLPNILKPHDATLLISAKDTKALQITTQQALNDLTSYLS
eukprot:g22425.t1